MTHNERGDGKLYDSGCGYGDGCHGGGFRGRGHGEGTSGFLGDGEGERDADSGYIAEVPPEVAQ